MRNKKGFTLIELLVVVAIIGILSTVVLASLGRARASARDAKRKAEIQQIKTQLELYFNDNGTYPVRGWTTSNNATQWAQLESTLGVDLPEDPTNNGTGQNATQNHYTYSYYGCLLYTSPSPRDA